MTPPDRVGAGSLDVVRMGARVREIRGTRVLSPEAFVNPRTTAEDVGRITDAIVSAGRSLGR